MGKRRTFQEVAEAAVRNDRRLQAVNAWLKTVNRDYWQVKSVASISGYIIGVWMKRKSDGYAILAQEGYMPRLIEAGWKSIGQWPSEAEAEAWLALRDRAQSDAQASAQAQEGAAQ